MEKKKCLCCSVTKDTTEFYKQQRIGDNGKVWPYYDSYCKSCRLGYAADRRRKIKEQAVNYLGGSCLDCGLVDDACVYDFHHLDPSSKDFSIGKQAKSFEKIKPELDKCVLLCANCHRKRHYS